MFTAYLLFCIPQLDIALPGNRVLDHPVFLSTQAFCHMLHIQTWNQFILHLHLITLEVSVSVDFLSCDWIINFILHINGHISSAKVDFCSLECLNNYIHWSV